MSVGAASATFEDCVIEENVAEYGGAGGVLAQNSRVRFVRCVVRGNSALHRCLDSSCVEGSGGGLDLLFSEAHLEDCIVGHHYDVRPHETIRGGALIRRA